MRDVLCLHAPFDEMETEQSITCTRTMCITERKMCTIRLPAETGAILFPCCGFMHGLHMLDEMLYTPLCWNSKIPFTSRATCILSSNEVFGCGIQFAFSYGSGVPRHAHLTKIICSFQVSFQFHQVGLLPDDSRKIFFHCTSKQKKSPGQITNNILAKTCGGFTKTIPHTFCLEHALLSMLALKFIWPR